MEKQSADVETFIGQVNQNLKFATDDELRAELKRRDDARIKGLFELRNKRFNNFTMEQLNIVKPEHSRTSCSDTDIANGFTDSRDSDGHLRHPRCGRCALLQIVQGGIEAAGDFDVTFDVHFNEIK